MPEIGATELSRFIVKHPKLTILSGAGCSTASGIPDYRDDVGKWKHRQPMQFSDFVTDAGKRRRYWAQSFAGWSRMSSGILKPDVVFFGEPVPGARVSEAQQCLQQSDALLVVGSSLMVFSGYRFARSARASGKPIAIVNRGTTRADDLAACKLTGDCGTALSQTVDILAA